MKKFIVRAAFLISLLAGGGLFTISSPVYAVDVISPACQGADANSAVCKENSTSNGQDTLTGPHGVITIVIQVLAIIIGFIAVVMIIAAGLKMVLAGGDSADLKEARSTLAHALAALAVAALAEVIVGFVLSKIP